jgi:hypothetical protein
MKQHSEIGEKIMASTELEGSQQAARLIRHHHEHYNGNGYPDKLAGENIPVCSRIIAIGQLRCNGRDQVIPPREVTRTNHGYPRKRSWRKTRPRVDAHLL